MSWCYYLYNKEKEVAIEIKKDNVFEFDTEAYQMFLDYIQEEEKPNKEVINFLLSKVGFEHSINIMSAVLQKFYGDWEVISESDERLKRKEVAQINIKW